LIQKARRAEGKPFAELMCLVGLAKTNGPVTDRLSF